MSTAPPATGSVATPRARLLTAAADWAGTDGLMWVYLFKTLAAAFLALGIAMKLDLPQPRTAITTVFIVMQPQSGLVFAKSFYRICGTLVGLVVMLALLALFAQEPELFLASTGLWVGICTAGAARNRNFRSYGFVLAGYTAALIGFPASSNPDGALLSALTRVAEVTLGILCAGAVSALVFPRYSGEQLRTTVRARFGRFVDYVASSLSGQIDRKVLDATHARFIADIVGFEAARSAAVFEGPDARMRSGRLSRLNSEFMTASTRCHALQQLMNRLRAASAPLTMDALDPYVREIAPLLANAGEPVQNPGDAARIAAQLDAYRTALPRRVRASRVELAVELGTARDVALNAGPDPRLLDFDTATELLYRLVDDLYAFSATYASLAADTHERERWIEHYEPKTNPLAAGIAGVRAFIVMLALGAFWIATAWPSGATLVLSGATICALVSTSPYPARFAWQLAIGTLVAAVVGMILMFGVYPHIDGFVLLCVVLTPCLAPGVLVSMRPKIAGYGIGYCIFFCFLAIPDNVTRYDPATWLNDALALVLAMLVASLSFALLLPPDTPWLRRRLLGDLRRQVVTVCGARPTRARSRFESGTRDLMSQLDALTTGDPDARSEALRWLYAVLETGNAVIDLRAEVAALPADARPAGRAPWRVAIDRTCETTGRLFDAPRADRFDAALGAADDAIAAMQQRLSTFVPSRDERHRLARILSHLHFLRTALLDPQSPLNAFSGSSGIAREERRHAA